MTTAPQLTRISDFVNYWARERPEREALIGPTGRWSYRRLQEDVDRCAAALLGAGVRRGDRVALLGDPRPESFAVFLACAGVGAIWVGLSPRYTDRELAQVLADSEPRVVFAMNHADRLAVLREAVQTPVITLRPARPGLSLPYDEFVAVDLEASRAAVGTARAAVRPADPVAMIYTSGTTGAPKGALVPSGGLAFCGRVQAGRWYGDRTRKLCDLPLNHIGGLGDICCSVLVAGGTIAFMERFDPAGALRLTERERLTHWYLIPTQLLALVQAPEWSTTDLSSLKRIVWGGAAAPAGLLRTLVACGAGLGTSYSLTESTGSVTYTDDGDPLDLLEWSIGRIDRHYEVRLVDEHGRTVESGATGEIQVRGDFITRGYFRNPEATRATIDDAGWLHTGDLAREEHNGHLRLVGRLKEMFKSGGYNVYPREIESVLESHPAVALAAVVGIPDTRWGEVGHAFVVAHDALTRESLESYARERLANYKVPKAFSFDADLPKLPVGKVDKGELRRRAAS